jgi:iron complex transport system substrate-binding protein
VTTRRRALEILVAVGLAACSVHKTSSGGLPAQRIVSLAPSTTEALFAIGDGPLVVGRSRFSDFPPEASRLPIVGDVQPDLERILELTPDLVVGTSGAATDRISRQLGAHGVDSLFPSGDSWQAMEALLIELGRRTGRLGEARSCVSAIDARADAVARSVANKPHPRVLFVVNLEPVVVAGPSSFLQEFVARAGGTNVVMDGPAWPTLGFERIAELDPDIVLDGTSPAGALEPSGIGRDSPGWGRVQAVRAGRVLRASDDRLLRPGPRMGEAVELLASLLHSSALRM